DVTITIDGEAHSAIFRPDLIEEQGEAGSTVGDFLAWLNEAFDGITAMVEDGDIVIFGEGLEDADITLDLLDSWRTLSSEAVGLTGPTGGASGGSITLTEFADLTGGELLGGDSVDFDIYIGHATDGGIL